VTVNELEDPRLAAKLIYEATVSALKGGSDAGSCKTLVAMVDQRFEATFDHLRSQGAPIACKSGCSFCCHLRVTLAPHEAIALLRFMRTEMPAPFAEEIEQRILKNAEKISSMTEEQHWSTNLQCAFLVAGRCSAYRARPMACALHHSLDVKGCEDSYANPADHSIGIRKLGVIEKTVVATQTATTRAFKELGLSDEPLELHTAVAAILRDPALMARWQSGGPFRD
jgi:Fe-S-cluster containining protein